MEAVFRQRFAVRSWWIIKPLVYKQRCIIWPVFLSHLALDLAEVTEVAGASYCSKEPFVSVQCSCTPLSPQPQWHWLSSLTHCWPAQAAPNLLMGGWQKLGQLFTVPSPKWGKGGFTFWHSCAQCSLDSTNPISPLEGCSLHQTHLLGKGASPKCLSWTWLNNSTAQQHQPPLPNPRCIPDLNEAWTLHALGGNTCDLLQLKQRHKFPSGSREQCSGCEALWSQEHACCNVSWSYGTADFGVLCRMSHTSELLCQLPGDKKNIQLVGEDQIFHFLGKL